MKRKATQSGSGGRLRLTLLMASIAAFLLVPAAAANAATNTIIEGAGAGSGEVVGHEGTPGEAGVPPVDCYWNGETQEKSGTCETEAQNLGGIVGLTVKAFPDPGSELAGWKVTGGSPFFGCQEVEPEDFCTAIFPAPVMTIEATFVPEPEKFPLTVSKTGSGSGTVTSSPSGIDCGATCEAEFIENTVVTLTGTPATGSEPVVWESCPGTVNGENKCEVTMDEAKEAVAAFSIESLSFTVNQEGEGTVQCSVNGGGSEACAAEYLYGDELVVTGTPEAEWALASLTGTGSAAGTCDKEAGTCTFTITQASSVSAQFKSEALRATETGEVFGEVPQTTTLESVCSSVDLGEFLPGVAANYSNTCGLVLTSTGAETQLSAADESGAHTGHLVQGFYVLPKPLQAKATDSEAKGTGPGLTALTSPVTLLTFSEPISKDAATLEFNQPIGENDGLHHGVYAKTVTLTLEQTNP